MTSSLAIRRLPWMAEMNLSIQNILGKPHELTAEIIRLLSLYPHDDDRIAALGIGKDEYAAYRFASLWEPGGALYVAHRGRRLEGLLHLVPQLWPSAVFNCHIWSVQTLVLSPDAPAETAEALMDAALGILEAPVEFISASLPASDGKSIRGLHKFGFRPVCGEVSGVVDAKNHSAWRISTPSIVPMESKHLETVKTIARDCRNQTSYACNPGFEPDRIGALQEQLMAGYVGAPHMGALVAENGSGEILGFINYQRNLLIEEQTHRRLANLDFIGVRQDQRGNGLIEILTRRALAFLEEQSVDAVTVNTPMTNSVSMKMLEVLRKIGFTLATSRMVLHHRLN